MEIAREYFRSPGFRLSYLDSAPNHAERPTILLLHGFPDEAAMCQKQIEAFHEAGYRYIAPDTLGCGYSEMAPREQDYDAIGIASDATALLDLLGIKKTQVIGHVWGGGADRLARSGSLSRAYGSAGSDVCQAPDRLRARRPASGTHGMVCAFCSGWIPVRMAPAR